MSSRRRGLAARGSSGRFPSRTPCYAVLPTRAARASKPAAKPLTKLAATGWVCATVLPVAAFLACGALGLPSQSAMFAAILTVMPGRATLQQAGVHLAIFGAFIALSLNP